MDILVTVACCSGANILVFGSAIAIYNMSDGLSGISFFSAIIAVSSSMFSKTVYSLPPILRITADLVTQPRMALGLKSKFLIIRLALDSRVVPL